MSPSAESTHGKASELRRYWPSIHRVPRKTVGAIATRGIGIGIGLAYQVAIARSLGATGAGSVYLAFALTAVAAAIGRFGTDKVLLRLSATARALREWPRLSATYARAVTGVIVTSSVVTLLGLISFAPASSIFPSLVEAKYPLLFAGLALTPTSVLSMHVHLLLGLGMPGRATFLQGSAAPLIALVLIALFHPTSFQQLLLLHTLALIVAASIAVVTWVRLIRLKSTEGGTQMHAPYPFLSASLPLFAVEMTNIAMEYGETLILSATASAADVGLYAVALRIARISSVALILTNNLVAPEIAALWAAKQWGSLRQLIHRADRTLQWVAMAFLVILMTLAEVILGLFGRDFVAAAPVLRILALGQFVVLATGPSAYVLMMSGHEKLHRNLTVLSAVASFLAALLVIPSMGMVGAAWVSSGSAAAKNILTFVAARRLLKGPERVGRHGS